MFCEDCGNKLPDNAKFCDACGARIDAPVYQAPLEEDAWPPPSPQQPPYASSQQTAAPRQTYAPQAKRPKPWLIIAIIASGLAVIMLFQLVIGHGWRGGRSAAG